MTEHETNGAGEWFNAPAVWNGRLATSIACAVRDLERGQDGRAREELRETLAAFIAEAGCSDELADTVAAIARLPQRVERAS